MQIPVSCRNDCFYAKGLNHMISVRFIIINIIISYDHHRMVLHVCMLSKKYSTAVGHNMRPSRPSSISLASSPPSCTPACSVRSSSSRPTSCTCGRRRAASGRAPATTAPTLTRRTTTAAAAAVTGPAAGRRTGWTV
jgi:hypothetical protein